MLLTDRNSLLGIQTSSGAVGAPLILGTGCAPTNPLCTWSYRSATFRPDANVNLMVNAYGGATAGGQILLSNACTTSNTACTFTSNILD
jgi:hypothetical protein